MDNGAALRLTIAKYYTPSGRSIQRSYALGKEAYAEDISERFHSGELTGEDTSALADTSKYYTSNKRTVYGGGGITPDIHVPYDTSKLNTALLNLLFSESTRNFLWDYFLRNRAQLKAYKDVAAYNAGFKTEALFEKLSDNIPGILQPSFKSVMSNASSKAYFQLQLKAQLARFLFRNNGYYTIHAQGDEVIQKALQALRGNQYSALIHR